MTTPAVQQIFNTGLQHQQAGRLAQAEAAYRSVLTRDPNHVDANHLLGLVCFQLGKTEPALELLRRALELKPDFTEGRFNLALVLEAAGHKEEAIAEYQRCVQARSLYFEAWCNLGALSSELGRHEEAITAFRAAVDLNPGHLALHGNLAKAQLDAGQPAAAIETCRRALATLPPAPEIHYYLASAFARQDDHVAAAAAFRQAIALRPNYVDACNGLAVVLQKTEDFTEAAALCRRLLSAQPELADTWNILAGALIGMGDNGEAVKACNEALRRKPDFVDAFDNLGMALSRQKKLDEAEAACRRAVAFRPDNATATGRLGNVLVDMGRLHEAIAAYQRTLDLCPSSADAQSSILLAMLYAPDTSPHAALEVARDWEGRHVAPLSVAIPPHQNTREPERKLRIGYLSGDFRTHSVAYFATPLLEGHHHDQVHVTCYSLHRFADKVTERQRSAADAWVILGGMNHAQAAERIRADGIDILVDLVGHTSGNPLPIFARKPAPLQVTYLGFPGTTGLQAIDYRMTDVWADPPGLTEAHYVEELLRLPRTAWCFTPLSGSPEINAPPVLRHGSITFGTFNAMPKINDTGLELWARVLREIPASRLILKNAAGATPSVIQRLHGFFARHGITADRVCILPPKGSSAEHLLTYHDVDIALDTYPYHGTTTTCEALWMGVPVVTLAGQTHVSRVGVSLLTNVGLPQCVAADPDEYVRIAAALARDTARLAELRRTLRPMMQASPLMDPAAFARDVEEAYRKIWRRWCQTGAATTGA